MICSISLDKIITSLVNCFQFIRVSQNNVSGRRRRFMLDMSLERERERALMLMSNMECVLGSLSTTGCKWKAKYKCQVDN